MAFEVWANLPSPLKAALQPREFLIYIVFRLFYRVFLRTSHKLFVKIDRLGRRGDDERINYSYEGSFLGFLEPKFGVLCSVLRGVYIGNGLITLLGSCGWIVRPDLPSTVTKIVYQLYAGYLLHETKRYFLPQLFTNINDDKRRLYITNRSTDVLVWIVTVLFGKPLHKRD